MASSKYRRAPKEVEEEQEEQEEVEEVEDEDEEQEEDAEGDDSDDDDDDDDDEEEGEGDEDEDNDAAAAGARGFADAMSRLLEKPLDLKGKVCSNVEAVTRRKCLSLSLPTTSSPSFSNLLLLVLLLSPC